MCAGCNYLTAAAAATKKGEKKPRGEKKEGVDGDEREDGQAERKESQRSKRRCYDNSERPLRRFEFPCTVIRQ